MSFLLSAFFVFALFSFIVLFSFIYCYGSLFSPQTNNGKQAAYGFMYYRGAVWRCGCIVGVPLYLCKLFRSREKAGDGEKIKEKLL